MLEELARRLDSWVAEQNLLARADRLPVFAPCTIRVIGQTALLEAALPIPLAATEDVDVRANYAFPVQQEFERLLGEKGRRLDPLGHEAWMPRETRYAELYKGHHVRVLLAEPEAVLLSKALKAPQKNGVLLTEYLALGASERFLKLAVKYSLDLEQFL